MIAAVKTRSAPYGVALRDSIAANGPLLDYFAEVSSIAVMDGDKILMGRRRDSGRWTLPGGHLEDGEDPHEGALRELAEETGILAQQLNYLGSQGVMCEDGRARMIHAYHMTASPDVTVKADPDQEVARWRWIDVSRGLPKHIADNLHAKRNVVLMFLDVYRSLGSGMYIDDLIKSRSHKYLRKYKGRNGEWVYVYHEGNAPGRVISPEAVQHLGELAALGHEGARAIGAPEAHDEGKLKLLRELADTGHEGAHEHLKSLGIDRAAERQEEKRERAKAERERQRQEAERQILGKDEVRHELSGDDLSDLHRTVKDAVDTAVFKYLAGHSSSPITRAISAAGITADSVARAIEGEKSVAGKLKALHEEMKKIDAVTAGTTSQNSAASSVGGYGSLAYNKAVDALVAAHFLPSEASSHRRQNGNLTGDLPSARSNVTPNLTAKRTERRERLARETRERGEREARERQAREDQARVEAERRAAEERQMAAELGGNSLTKHMLSMFDRSMSSDEVRNLHRALKNIFGDGLTKEHWPYDFSAHGLKTKITRLSASSNSVNLEMQVYDAQGRPMMEGWSRSWSKGEDGRPVIENRFMAVDPNARSTVQVGNLINQGQRNMLKALPRGGRVRVHANCDVGGYNWCNQGFSFDSGYMASTFRLNFKRFLEARGINLTDEDLAHFTEPVHFAAFDDGKKYVVNMQDLPRSRGNPMPLSQKQKETRSLSGVEGEHPLTADEINSGKTSRMALHLGKMFMLGSDWYGTWDSARETDAAKFAEAYYQLRDRAAKHLAPQYQRVTAAVRAGDRGRGRVAEAPPPTVPRASFGSAPAPAEPHAQHADRYIRYWRRGERNIVLSPRRLRTIGTWTTEQMTAFLNRAPLSDIAKRKIRELIRSRG